MDLNGGVNPADQTNSGAEQYSLQPQELQQAPMSGADPAYQPEASQPVYSGQVQPQIQQAPVQNAEPQYVAQSQAQFQPQPQQQVVGQPIQDVRPNWQQELEYSSPVDPPWTQQQAGSTAASGGITSYSGASINQGAGTTNQIPTEAYNLLTEPYSDVAPVNSTGGRKKTIFIFVILLLALSLVAGAVYLAYKTGYKKGADDTSSRISRLTQESNTSSDSNNNDATNQDEPNLDFELKKPEYINEDIVGFIGEQLESSDGLVMLVNKVDSNFEIKDPSGGSGATLKATKVDILLGNSDESKNKAIKASNFVLIGSNNFRINALDDIASSNNIPTSFTLNPGMKVKMSLLFFVPEDSGTLTLNRSQAYKLGEQTLTSSIIVKLSNNAVESKP